jgi:AraC-like DNA-binding protein
MTSAHLPGDAIDTKERLMKAIVFNYHDVVLALTFVEVLALCLALRLLPANRLQPRRLLIAFFLLIAGTLLTTVVTWNRAFQVMPIAHSTVIPILLSASLLLQGPVLYYHFRSLAETIEFRRWTVLLHLSPGILVILIIVGFDISIHDWVRYDFSMHAWLPWNWRGSNAEAIAISFVRAIVTCAPLGYVLACLYSEVRLRRQLRQIYSSISAIELRAADVVLGGFLLHWLWAFVAYFLGDKIDIATHDLLGILNNYLTVFLVNGLFVFGLVNRRQLFHPDLIAPISKEERLPLPDQAANIAAIDNAIHGRRLYLENHINLERFAEQVGLRPRVMSNLIHSHYGLNFFEFINGLRVEEAKRLLLSKECADDTILDIAFKAGFNSQSAFHRFFKRLVGATPSEYRRGGRRLEGAGKSAPAAPASQPDFPIGLGSVPMLKDSHF